MAIVLRSGFPFNYDTVKASDDSGLKCKDASLARQSEAEACDINTIVKRFHLSGELPQGLHVPSYGDFSGVYDYQSALNLVRKAEEAFMLLPADVRARFHNEPAELLSFVGEESNREEAVKLGLVVAKPVVAVVVPPVVPLEPLPPKVV